jgi:glucokinase
MAMGTGLGVGLLLSTGGPGKGKRANFHIVATEGGHMLATRPASGRPFECGFRLFIYLFLFLPSHFFLRFQLAFVSYAHVHTRKKNTHEPWELLIMLTTKKKKKNPIGRNESDDDALMEYVSQELYGGAKAMEWEDVCSGRGLELTHRWLCSRQPDAACESGASGADAKSAVTAKAIAERAGEDATCREAMRFHYRFLMRAAQQLAILTQCRGVILAGDNQFHNDAIVRGLSAELRETFLHHPHAEWLADVAIYVPQGVMNMNIHGAMHVAYQMATVGHL